MSELNRQQLTGISFRGIGTAELDTLGVLAYALREYSLGWDSDVADPISKLLKAEYLVGAFAEGGQKFIGGASVRRHASPDGIDDDEQWLADLVVFPEFQHTPIIVMTLYTMRMTYVEAQPGRILMATKDKRVAKVMQHLPWTILRKHIDTRGVERIIMEYKRQ